MPLIKPAWIWVLGKLTICSFGLRRLKCFSIIKRAELCLVLNLEVRGATDFPRPLKEVKSFKSKLSFSERALQLQEGSLISLFVCFFSTKLISKQFALTCFMGLGFPVLQGKSQPQGPCCPDDHRWMCREGLSTQPCVCRSVGLPPIIMPPNSLL